MSHHEIPELDTKGLRQFGLMLGAILAVIFGLLLPWAWEWENLPNLQWIGTGVIVIAWALIAPDSMRGLYNGWMRVALVIGHVINSIILAIVYFIVITPMGIVMRLMGKDPMRRTLDKTIASYRVISKVADRNHVERPY
ncbi:hypothetical protein F3F96_10110 [Mariprofundus sp. NF]|uniref:SxtJ family membrane protein n=1 Tax=Mariprofundus sp. NF TaxID=2608716 RepID=UPI0015A2ECAA|nr:SxtJ family membrane protein [Mariprofundus sp. NF]NWF39487.1 hypothetical protein [Mariprofundus sp. NF]